MRSFGLGSRLAFAGAVAIGAALATGELLAGLLPDVPSPLIAVAQFIVDIQPAGAKEIVVGLFGTADKLAFQVFIVLVALIVGAILGRVAAKWPDVAAAIVVAFSAAGFAASLREPAASAALAVFAAGAEALIGIVVLRRLVSLAVAPVASGRVVREAQRPPQRPDGRPRVKGQQRGAAAAKRGSMPDWSRRALLQAGGAIAVGSVFAGAIGRTLLERTRTQAPAAGDVPIAPVPVSLPPGADIATADLTAEGLTPIVVPNDDFYRIDTALLVPTVDRATWSLRIFGLVDREITLTYDELVALPIIDQYVTIACVSNEVGQNLVGNAKWTGVPLRTVLDLAGVQSSADQLVGRSVDGFTVGMPVEWVMDKSRVPMVAVGMNGDPLPPVHGYPARLIVPGLYGYVSATKWVTELELTTFAQYQAFWVPRGWAQKAPILTQSRIDVPQSGANVKAGHVAVAGVAWAPDRGITRVEVRIDGGDWAPTKLSTPISKATWVQWLYDWTATSGQHLIEVRATDGTGDVQTDQQTPPAPDGARGHHQIQVSVA